MTSGVVGGEYAPHADPDPAQLAPVQLPEQHQAQCVDEPWG